MRQALHTIVVRWHREAVAVAILVAACLLAASSAQAAELLLPAAA